MPTTKARSGAFQKGADLPAIRQAGEGAIENKDKRLCTILKRPIIMNL